ncbi:UDP-glycosyltransferase 76B1-like [Mangifera indica]|uniref:UDP-glycosyltransferase 76B1-like n=1 Tax=Mangifera indica TaxID=29780 RepID=UPI001CFB0DDB|nr:UDP-glycosyltransferase 76B1-like [Mangifera indica]
MENQRESGMKERKKRRVILFPLPLQGHINPMLQLANILYDKGLSITVIHTNFNSPNSSNYPHFHFCSIPDGLLELGASSSDVVALTTHLNVNCVVPFRDCLDKLLSNVEEEESTACLITDAACHFTHAVADSLNLPRIVLRTSSIASLLAFAATSLLHEKGYFPIEDLGSEAPMPEFPSLRVKDIPLIHTQDEENFYQLLISMITQIKASSGLIWNSFQELEQDTLKTLEHDFRIPIFTIGPFHKYLPASSSSLLSQDTSSISWLDKQAPKSVLYVSFGSIVAFNETEFLEIAWGLAGSGVPFLWVVRPGLIRGYEWLEPLPKGFLEKLDGRAHIVKWAPQQEVLAHPATGGFWTHNGWNSTLESICEGVPMICQPCFGDQLVNARYVSHIWRVGLHLENRLKRGEIERVIRRVILEAEGKEMRDRIMDLKKKVDVSLRQGGSAYQSLESLISYIESF